jgi:ferredoxin-NADP reductase
VEGGQLTPRLARVEPGDRVGVEALKGRFTLAKAHPFERLLFVATGTGVAPFRSFVRSSPEQDYFLVHGVRTVEEDFAAEFCRPERRVVCISAPPPWTAGGPLRSGRVTAWLESMEPGTFDRAYLCGNARMIAQALPILVDKGIAEARIHTETYF